MKILLINPPQTYYEASAPFYRLSPPLGLLYIAAMLEKNNFSDIAILDCILEDPAAKKLNDGSYLFGLNFESIEKKIQTFSPELVGISIPFSSQVQNGVSIAKLVKKIDSKIITVAGGPHISVKTDLLKENCLDYGIIGEGEMTFLKLIQYLIGQKNHKPHGLSFKASDGTLKTSLPSFIQNLDLIEFPAYHLVDMHKYFKLAKKGLVSRPGQNTNPKSISLITSRGCPYQCIFCSIHCHMGKKWRAHSAEYVMKHINFLLDKYGIEHIHFEDDNLTLNQKRFENILNGILSRKLSFKWDTPNGVRADTLNLALLRKMKNAGLSKLTIGVESGVQTVLDNIIKKNLQLSKVLEIASICQKEKIQLAAFFVIGFPGETRKDIKQTLNFAFFLHKKFGVEYSIPNLATPLIGTELYKICLQKKLFTDAPSPKNLSIATCYAPLRKGLIRTEHFSPDELNKLCEQLAKKFFRHHKFKILTNPSYFKEAFKKKLKTLIT